MHSLLISYKIDSVLQLYLGHLLALGIGAALLFAKAVYLGGLYDTWACGGGDMRLIERLECALNPYLLGQYLIRPPFGSSAWIISVNNMEDLIGGYWHIQTRALTMTTRAFTWSAEAYLSYTLSAVTLCGSITSLFSWYNNTAYPSGLCKHIGLKLSEHHLDWTYLKFNLIFKLGKIYLSHYFILLEMLFYFSRPGRSPGPDRPDWRP